MPALNFKAQFADAVERGEKRQTIRAFSKRLIVSGAKLYLYTGMRTKLCHKLGEVVAKTIELIEIGTGESLCGISLTRKALTAEEKEALARADGFASTRELLQFFEKTHGLPFKGILIKW